MSRSDIPDIRDRRPFYLYVDEFQNFATDSFATILSEARKYGLNLTVANQYISQMTDTVRDAVFGNVGTMITFRVSADDAPILAKQFEPNFEATDLLQMHNRNFVINMVIGGEKTPAFSARTLELPPAQTDNTLHIIEHSRRFYSRNRSEVEQEISATMQPATAQQPAQKKPSASPAAQPAPARTASSSAANTPVAPQQSVQGTIAPDPVLNSGNSISATTDPETPPKPKRKRTRSRRKKKTGESTSAPAAQTTAKPAKQSSDDGVRLQIKH